MSEDVAQVMLTKVLNLNMQDVRFGQAHRIYAIGIIYCMPYPKINGNRSFEFFLSGNVSQG